MELYFLWFAFYNLLSLVISSESLVCPSIAPKNLLSLVNSNVDERW